MSSIDISDIELIEKCISGDRKYQELFYKKFSKKMYNICQSYANSGDDAKDILQDGFVKIFTSLNTYNGVGSLEGWVRKIIVNTAIDFYRKRLKEMRNVNIDDVYDLPFESSVLDEINSKELIELIHKLPEGAKLIFNLFVIEGYSHEEIARKLNISTGTSKSQVSRAKSLLKDLIVKFSTVKIAIEKT